MQWLGKMKFRKKGFHPLSSSPLLVRLVSWSREVVSMLSDSSCHICMLLSLTNPILHPCIELLSTLSTTHNRRIILITLCSQQYLTLPRMVFCMLHPTSDYFYFPYFQPFSISLFILWTTDRLKDTRKNEALSLGTLHFNQVLRIRVYLFFQMGGFQLSVGCYKTANSNPSTDQ